MPPALALLASCAFLIILFRHDPANTRAHSPALWLPLTWMFFTGSRLPAQWLGLMPGNAAMAFEEGSALDRTLFLVFTLVGLAVLARRRLKPSDVFARNVALIVFLVFALASAVWSDYVFITFKRWIRDVGLYVMLLVVLSDPRPLDALSIVLRRLSFLLIVLSVLCVKYYRDIGVAYNPWTGVPEYMGVTTSKNMLGAVCVISGMYFFWDALERWPERKVRSTRWVLLIDIAFIAMTLWLLRLSQSATSNVCLVLGCLIIKIARTRWAKNNVRRLTRTILFALAAYAVLEFGFDFSSTVAPLLGRDPTLTGRTGLWQAVLAVQTNPLVGVGYQSFWLGDRMASVARSTRAGFLNESHNGYLEVYLNLGIIGLALIAAVLISGYRTIRARLALSPHLGAFGLAIWTVMLIYNFTEAAFVASLMWWVFLLFIIVVPRPAAAIAMQRMDALAARPAQGIPKLRWTLRDGRA